LPLSSRRPHCELRWQRWFQRCRARAYDNTNSRASRRAKRTTNSDAFAGTYSDSDANADALAQPNIHADANPNTQPNPRSPDIELGRNALGRRAMAITLFSEVNIMFPSNQQCLIFRSIARVFAVLCLVLSSHGVAAAELIVTNEFSRGTPAVAAEVNQNFDDVEAAVNDNNTRINSMETDVLTNSTDIGVLQIALEELTTRVENLESAPEPASGVSVHSFFATDLVFLLNSGVLWVPEVEGNRTPSGNIGSGRDWHPLPGLTDVSFDVAENATTVIFNAKGHAAYPYFSAYAYMEVAILVDGSGPENGAKEELAIVTDDNQSYGSAAWNILFTKTLDAGVHSFSVVVRDPFGQNQESGSISIDGRSGEGYDGLVKTTLIQIAP